MTIARFDDLFQIFPSQLDPSHLRSHLLHPFGGSSQDHEQGRQQTYHMFRQRHTRSNVFQKRPPFCFNKISRRRLTEFFFFLSSRNAFLWGRSRAIKSGRTENWSLVKTFKTHRHVVLFLVFVFRSVFIFFFFSSEQLYPSPNLHRPINRARESP